MSQASPALEAFTDEMIRLCAKKGYHPTAFKGMRERHGTLEAMRRLVRNGDVQSGFLRLTELGLQDWTIEAAILRFKPEFDRTDIECARWRLAQASRAV
ncbi:hypothetical protein GCM10008171_14410 [Methylopila jiangsuensis]|uniref:Uncharacterized protein n=1 Tax=Methylopila jiangsuensis TaxID=586230 RepID=A0A9W6JFB8_9HYPH|nr:hypothetical protein [Methylopila jiangsuensis]GLK76187.1 hypothetical protein GCM10008171_14410 [Methylopila jiangsuensis]